MPRYVDLDRIDPLTATYSVGMAREIILNVLPVEYVRPVIHASWIRNNANSCYCSRCLDIWTSQTIKSMRYCPSCGAKMDEEVL